MRPREGHKAWHKGRGLSGSQGGFLEEAIVLLGGVGGAGAGKEKQESKEAQGERKTELSTCNVHSPHCPEVHKSQVTVPAIGKVCALAILISQMKKLRPRKQN